MLFDARIASISTSTEQVHAPTIQHMAQLLRMIGSVLTGNAKKEMQKMAEWICGEKTSPLGYQYLDVVHREELIRCKDCKYWLYESYCDKHDKGQENADWFCAGGERREDE